MHPIFALWAHPRSMSTAIERVMRERGDLICLHEPFMNHYYLHRGVRDFPHFTPVQGAPVSYDEVRSIILTRAEEGPVFFKDMAYYVADDLPEDPEFMHRLTHGFLVRDPLAAIPSYHRLDPDFLSEEVGLGRLAELYDVLTAAGISAPVLEADRVRADTRGQMAAFWDQIGLPFRAEAFDWGDETPADWSHVIGWHGDVARAGGIRAVDTAELSRRQARFDAAAADAPQLAGYLETHRPYYDRMAALAI